MFLKITRDDLAEFGIGLCMACIVLAGMVLFQFAGETLEARLVAQPVASAGR